MTAIIEPQYPEPDPEREKRIVNDVISLMKLSNDEARRKMVTRWLEFTLTKAQRFNRLPWWFARRLFACMVYEGQDVFDLQGKLDRIIAVFCPLKLTIKPIGFIIEKRSTSHKYERSNLGEPVYYALHSGRIHLWPVPDSAIMLAVTYSRQLSPDIVPVEWESFLLDGVIGLYGRHFDSSGLLENANEFTARFWEGLKASRNEHFDTESFERKDRDYPANQGMSVSQAYAEINSVDFENAILKPAYDGAPGEIQILANREKIQKNKRGTPIAQIPGDHQP